MTKTLKHAFEEISKLPEVDQKFYASLILEELASRGNKRSELSPDWQPSARLQGMVERAREQQRLGETISLDEFFNVEDD